MSHSTWHVHRPIHRPTISTGSRTALVPRIASAPWVRSLALLAIIALLTWVGFTQLRTPDVKPITAAETSFSAERAMVHLDQIAEDQLARFIAGRPGNT